MAPAGYPTAPLKHWQLLAREEPTCSKPCSLQDLVKRARAKQLAPDEYSTGTFTISNMGMYGADAFDAILPPGAPRSQLLSSHPCASMQLPRKLSRSRGPFPV